MHFSNSLIAFALLPVWFFLATTVLAQEKIAPKVQKIIDALEQALPAYEQAVDQLDQELVPLMGSADPQLNVAVNSARLQIMSLRSIRKMIAEQPDYLLYHISPANLPRWKEGAEYYLACARSGQDP